MNFIKMVTEQNSATASNAHMKKRQQGDTEGFS